MNFTAQRSSADTSAELQRIEKIFHAALECEPGGLGAFLDNACAGDESLRQKVEALLRSDQQASDFIDTPRTLAARALENKVAEADSIIGLTIGHYKIRARLGAGGMGVVYLAERIDDQYRKQVAIKLIKRGMDTEEVLRHFRDERQILADFDHPHIARLFDAGTTEDGLPYFIMEYVAGEPIDECCNNRNFSINERLQLFRQVCAAVSYAHRHLVIHRDIKPSNILVTKEGVPKLLDFGIAKILQSETSEGLTITAPGQRTLTPEYASPEQVQGSRITTVSDVYSLGVVLYKVLTGQSPYRVTSRSPHELARAIVESEPEKPSQAIAERSDNSRSTIRNPKLLRGDLDNIVLRAMRKETARRYKSVDQFSEDIGRYLEGLPVLARKDTILYRSTKFVRRNKVALTAAALVFLTLVGGIIAIRQQARRAEGEARKAVAVKDFLKSLFSAADPFQAQGKEPTARQLLDDGARRIERELKDQPDVQFEVTSLIADIYHHLGDYDRVRTLMSANLERCRRIEGPHSIALAELLESFASASYDAGRYDEALSMFEEALAIQRLKQGEHTAKVAALVWAISGVKRQHGDLRAAEELQKQALAIYIDIGGQDSADVIKVRESLASTYHDSDRFAEGTAIQEKVAAWSERHLGSDNLDTLIGRHNYAYQLIDLGRTAEAIPIAEDTVTRRRRVLGPRHSDLGSSLQVLARALNDVGRTEEALPHISEALAIHHEAFGPSHREFAWDLSWQSMFEARAGQLAAAERDCTAAQNFFKNQPTIRPYLLCMVQSNAAFVLAEAGRLEEAETQLSEAIALCRARGFHGVTYARALDMLGDVARRRDQAARAAELGKEAIAVQGQSAGENNLLMALARVHTGAALCATGQSDEGERLLRTGVEWLEHAFPNGHFDLATGRFLLGQALVSSGRIADARPFLQGALDWRQAHLGPNDPRTAVVLQSLGTKGLTTQKHP